MFLRFTADVTETGERRHIDVTINEAGVLTIANELVQIEDVQPEITSFLQSRAALVIAAQPDLTNFLSGHIAGAFNADVTQGHGHFNLGNSGKQPVWASVQGAWSEDGDNESNYFFGVAGAHINLTPDAIAGIMLQFDTLTQDDGETEAEGRGYFVGPYFVAKLPEQPLYLEGRFLVGKTENSVSIDGADDQDFDTDRTLASVKLAGQMVYGDLILTPSLSATRLEDIQESFSDNGGNAVAEQSATVTDVSVGLDFARQMRVDNGSVIFTGGVTGIWSETEGSGFAETLTSSYEGQRGRAHLGVAYALANGAIVSAGANYDGIGADDYESFGISLGLDLTF